VHPSHVVVDTRDGYVFRTDSDEYLFDAETAAAFAKRRNPQLNPELGSYWVFKLVPEASPEQLGDDTARPDTTG
jgi:hypothetical protein